MVSTSELCCIHLEWPSSVLVPPHVHCLKPARSLRGAHSHLLLLTPPVLHSLLGGFSKAHGRPCASVQHAPKALQDSAWPGAEVLHVAHELQEVNYRKLLALEKLHFALFQVLRSQTDGSHPAVLRLGDSWPSVLNGSQVTCLSSLATWPEQFRQNHILVLYLKWLPWSSSSSRFQ